MLREASSRKTRCCCLCSYALQTWEEKVILMNRSGDSFWLVHHLPRKFRNLTLPNGCLISCGMKWSSFRSSLHFRCVSTACALFLRGRNMFIFLLFHTWSMIVKQSFHVLIREHCAGNCETWYIMQTSNIYIELVPCMVISGIVRFVFYKFARLASFLQLSGSL